MNPFEAMRREIKLALESLTIAVTSGMKTEADYRFACGQIAAYRKIDQSIIELQKKYIDAQDEE